jgi:YfiH family protein
VLECVPLGEIARHGWTTRDLKLEGADERCGVEWASLAAGENVGQGDLVRLRQVHGAAVVSERDGDSEADAIVSADPTRLLTVKVADCLPLLIADRRTGVVAAVHAGWRGTASGIARAAVERMRTRHGSSPEDLVAAIGPAIRACCYEVGPELRDAFASNGATPEQLARWFGPGRADRLQLDVPLANVEQLLAAGIPSGQVHDSGLCTACHPAHFYSYRRDKGLAGRIIGFVMARERRT